MVAATPSGFVYTTGATLTTAWTASDNHSEALERGAPTRLFAAGTDVYANYNGGVLDLTVANYYLPDGETISTKGIKPEVRAEDDPDTERDEALPVALETLGRELR